jgi:hypothetical protein
VLLHFNFCEGLRGFINDYHLVPAVLDKGYFVIDMTVLTFELYYRLFTNRGFAVAKVNSQLCDCPWNSRLLSALKWSFETHIVGTRKTEYPFCPSFSVMNYSDFRD